MSCILIYLERITHLQPKGNQICMTIMESISVLLNLNFHPDSFLNPCLQLAATSIMECPCSSVVPFSYSLFSEIRFSLSGSIGQVLVAFFLRTENPMLVCPFHHVMWSFVEQFPPSCSLMFGIANFVGWGWVNWLGCALAYFFSLVSISAFECSVWEEGNLRTFMVNLGGWSKSS